MTKKTLDILSKNPNGFFAMIEGASIDKQLHVMDWQRSAYDTIEFDKSIEYAENWAKEHGDDTLNIVLADHAHGMSISGTYHERDGKKGTQAVRVYADSIFPTFKDANKDGFPDNPDPDVTLAIQYANHPEYYENYHFMKTPKQIRLASIRGIRQNSCRPIRRSLIRRNAIPLTTFFSMPAAPAPNISTAPWIIPKSSSVS